MRVNKQKNETKWTQIKEEELLDHNPNHKHALINGKRFLHKLTYILSPVRQAV